MSLSSSMSHDPHLKKKVPPLATSPSSFAWMLNWDGGGGGCGGCGGSGGGGDLFEAAVCMNGQQPPKKKNKKKGKEEEEASFMPARLGSSFFVGGGGRGSGARQTFECPGHKIEARGQT